MGADIHFSAAGIQVLALAEGVAAVQAAVLPGLESGCIYGSRRAVECSGYTWDHLPDGC